MSDIIDDIDSLVDEQLAGYDARSGYDHNLNQETCPHCCLPWHGLPITEQIFAMYVLGQFDERYRVDTDDSRVLCRGSEFIGPMATPPALSQSELAQELGIEVGPDAPPWLRGLIQASVDYAIDQQRVLMGLPPMPNYRYMETFAPGTVTFP